MIRWRGLAIAFGGLLTLGLLVLYEGSVWNVGVSFPHESSPTKQTAHPEPLVELPDSIQAEWTYCGNADGPCTVDAYVDGIWVRVRLVRTP